MNNSLQSLNISGIFIKNNNNNKYYLIILIGNEIGDEGVKIISESLKLNNFLESLDLSCMF